MLSYLLLTETLGIILKNLQVPVNATEGDRSRLVCEFDLEGFELYSVKWYKDEVEIFRYVPTSVSPVRSFPTEGVTINVSTCLSL